MPAASPSSSNRREQHWNYNGDNLIDDYGTFVYDSDCGTTCDFDPLSYDHTVSRRIGIDSRTECPPRSTPHISYPYDDLHVAGEHHYDDCDFLP